MSVRINGDSIQVRFGELLLIPLGLNENLPLEIEPAKGFDLGAGKGKPVALTVEGGTVGLILDARGRPIAIPAEDNRRASKIREWLSALGLSAGV
jgi:hypothetical protein